MRANVLLPFVLVGILWFLVVRPQRLRVRHHRDLLASLQPGDEVVTAAGLVGRLVDLGPERARIEVAPGTVLTVLRPAIQRRLDPEPAGAGPVPDAEPAVDRERAA